MGRLETAGIAIGPASIAPQLRPAGRWRFGLISGETDPMARHELSAYFVPNDMKHEPLYGGYYPEKQIELLRSRKNGAFDG